MVYKLKIISNRQMPFLQYITLGVKKAECRIATDYIKNFKIGRNLILFSNFESVLCKIIYLNFYDSFEDMLDNEGVNRMVPFVKDTVEALKVYNSFPGSERVKSLGCCAIGVSPLKSKLKFTI